MLNVHCDLCGMPTEMASAKRCLPCLKLERRIVRDPDLVRRILDAIPLPRPEERNWMGEVMTPHLVPSVLVALLRTSSDPTFRMSKTDPSAIKLLEFRMIARTFPERDEHGPIGGDYEPVWAWRPTERGKLMVDALVRTPVPPKTPAAEVD